MFGVCVTIAFNALGVSSASPIEAVLINLYQIAAGFAAGIALGLLMKFFRKLTRKVKAVVVLFVAFFIVIISEVVAFHESKYIGVIVYGYVCYRMGGEDKPEHELAQVWLYFMPFLFGSVGASI